MTEQKQPRLAKWPFFIGDAIFIFLGWFFYSHANLPFGKWEIIGLLAAGAFGATLGVLPFILEYRALLELSESNNLASTVEQIQNLEKLAGQISTATSQWQTVQEQSSRAVGAAQQIGDRMATEAASFADFMQKTNDTEKAHLRLEVEKLRRSEGEWLQILVRLLDHVFALHSAAARSGQAGLIEQLTNFQNACRDVARRVGLLAFAPSANDPFDGERHRLAEPDAQPAPDSKVGEILATGYTFQGQLLRPALVTLKVPVVEQPAVEEKIIEPVAAQTKAEAKAEDEALEEPTLL